MLQFVIKLKNLIGAHFWAFLPNKTLSKINFIQYPAFLTFQLVTKNSRPPIVPTTSKQDFSKNNNLSQF